MRTKSNVRKEANNKVVDHVVRQWMGIENKTQPKGSRKLLPSRLKSPKLRIHYTSLKGGIIASPEFQLKGLANWAVNTGLKCSHDCTYCSTGAMVRCHPAFKTAKESPFGFGYSIIDPDSVARIQRDARDRDRTGIVQLCTTVDAWAPEAQAHNLGQRCLKTILEETDLTVRILTKNAAVVRDYDLIAKYKDRVMLGLSLTAPIGKSALTKVTEPNASPIEERIKAIKIAHQLGFRTYGMLCPLLPEVADGIQDIEELVDIVLEYGAEEIFVEPVNARGPGLINTQNALAAAGFLAEAAAVGRIRKRSHWSEYAIRLIQTVQGVLAARNQLPKLRFLLYRKNLLPEHLAWVKAHPQGVVLLGS